MRLARRQFVHLDSEVPRTGVVSPLYPLTLGAAIVATWYWLLGVHELGHVAAAVLTGGTVDHVTIPLVGFSRTDTSGGVPIAIVWAGPIVGVLLPTALWLSLRSRGVVSVLIAFFAAACLLGNGIYLMSGVGDAADLDRLGAGGWIRWLVGLAMVAVSLRAMRDARPLWMNPRDVPRSVTLTAMIACAVGILLAVII